LDCGTTIEKALEHVLNIADACSPEVALVTADTLTKLMRDVGAAPLFLAETTKANGTQLRHIVQVLAHILRKIKPQKIRSVPEMEQALKSTKAACQTFSVSDEATELFILLVQEIARVFFELRAILKRQRGVPSKRLFNAVDNYMCKVRQAVLCFSYNSLKLRVCMESIEKCGPKSSVGKDAVRKVIANVHKLATRTRTMAVLAAYHHGTVKRALALTQA
jgi:hypothetical protein